MAGRTETLFLNLFWMDVWGNWRLNVHHNQKNNMKNWIRTTKLIVYNIAKLIFMLAQYGLLKVTKLPPLITSRNAWRRGVMLLTLTKSLAQRQS
jgi:hypothetical protein